MLRLRATTAAVTLLAATAGSAHDLPLGDGKISSQPQVGYVFACQSHLAGGGAQRAGPWLGRDSWNPDAKPAVTGAVTWPETRISVSREGDRRIVRANNLPNHPTGRFPIAPEDPAYQYDRNPNAIEQQRIVLSLPALPALAAQPSCVPMGMIGFSLTGAAIFNALDAQGRDAPAHELQDRCHGHPQPNGQYHYHDYSNCMTDTRSERGGHSDLVGYALDGFGIYGPYGANGVLLGDADLDACHGHRHEVIWDGAPVSIYHYHLTHEYPYTIGCFRGSPAGTVLMNSAAGPRAETRDRDREGIIVRAAAELGIAPTALRSALGPPPPDFNRAARLLGISSEKIRAALTANRPPPR
jgi:hypothetical protein